MHSSSWWWPNLWTLWNSPGLVDNKHLYEWTFTGMQPFSAHMRLQGPVGKGRFTYVNSSHLVPVSAGIPEMSMAPTAEYFVDRLSAADKDELATTLRSLDGKVITIGSTCSGTDLIIPVMKHTFATLSQMFQVTCSCLITVLYELFFFPKVTVWSPYLFWKGFMQLEYGFQPRYLWRCVTFSVWKYVPKHVNSFWTHIVEMKSFTFLGMSISLRNPELIITATRVNVNIDSLIPLMD